MMYNSGLHHLLLLLVHPGLPDGPGDVGGGPVCGPRRPNLQGEHPGHQGHRGVPEAGGTEVPA